MSKQTAETTKVIGYFNPNTWSVQVDISGYMKREVKPNTFVEDDRGRYINDPILDQVVGKKMLERKVGDKEVPILRVQVASLRPANNSTSSVGVGVRDPKTRRWGPPRALPAPPAPAVSVQAAPAPDGHPPANYSPIGAMTVEQARKAGFIGRQRLVPEDYGADETTGAPQAGQAIPRIRHSIEAPAPAVKAGALPKELVEQVQPQAAPIVKQLQEASSADPEAQPDLSRSAARRIVRDQQGEAGVKAFDATVKEIKTAAPAATAQAPATPPAKRTRRATPVAQPVAPVAAQPAAPAEPEILVTATPLPDPEISEAAPEAPAPSAPVAGHQCPVEGCSATPRYRSELIRHIRRAHKDQAEALVAQLGSAS